MQASRRELMKTLAASAVLGAGWRAGAVMPAADRFAGVDPEMVDDLRPVKTMVVTRDTLATFRTRSPSPQAHPSPVAEIDKVPLGVRMIPGLPDRPAVRTLIFDGAPGRKNRGALIWIHGGGYVAGAAGIGAGCALRHGSRDG